jgi:hypothetical protein
MVPAGRPTAGTMFAALYGELVPHAWRDPESEHDTDSLFYHRSIAMGWFDDRSAGVASRTACSARQGCGAGTTPGGTPLSPLPERD